MGPAELHSERAVFAERLSRQYEDDIAAWSAAYSTAMSLNHYQESFFSKSSCICFVYLHGVLRQWTKKHI